MKKRTLCLLLAGILCLSLLAGCGPAEPTTKETPPVNDTKSVELSVVTSYGGDDGNRGNYEAAVKDYETASGNKVLDASATSNEEWKAKVMSDFESGTEPDVLFYFSNADSNAIIEAGKVVSLDEIRKEYPNYASNMKDDMMAKSAVDGKVYAVPSSGFWESMFVNTKVLKACGVAVPGPDYTWDQFLADCETIKAAGYTPIAASLQEVPHYWFEFMVYNHGTTANHLDLPAKNADGSWDETGEKWIAGLEDIKTLYDKGYFPTNTLTANDAETVALFGDGEAAFLIDGSWKVGHFVKEYPDQLDDYTLAFTPGQNARKASDNIGGISMGYFITRKAWDNPEKRAAAVAFVEHMTSDSVMSTFVTTEVTALKNGATPAGLNALQQSAAAMCGKTTSVVGAVQDALSKEARADLFASVKNIVTGQLSASDALAAAMALN